MPMTSYGVLADIVLLLHLGVVLFIVGGLALIWAGRACSWQWVNTWRFRLIHLAAILVVVAEAWLGIACPLTVLERWLRNRAGERFGEGGFIQNWIHSILFYDFEPWVFTLAYTLFALLVIATWWKLPPRKA